jgi:hypothetical protein
LKLNQWNNVVVRILIYHLELNSFWT